ncbi:MAG: hypothetical protein JKY65_03015 [Planctomycetes bacterium]|nr:hypothetical protein [Planctomycetota bacterium]
MTSVAVSTSTSERPPHPFLPARAADGSSVSDPLLLIGLPPAGPDDSAARRLGLRTALGWTASGQALLARVRAQAAALPCSSLDVLRLDVLRLDVLRLDVLRLDVIHLDVIQGHVERWAATLDLRWVRCERGPDVDLEGWDAPVPCVFLAGGPLRFVGSDRFGRRVVLASATRISEGWRLDLAPCPESILDHLVESGRWPLWLAEVQVRVLPIGADQLAPAKELAERLSAKGWRVQLDTAGPLSGRVHGAARTRVPALCVLGAREVADDLVSLRWRGQRGHSLLSEADLYTSLSQAHTWNHPAENSSAERSSDRGDAQFEASNRRH